MGFDMSRILTLECFAGAEVLAGHRGLSREVHLVNVMEVPDISNWVTENELILTTAYPFKDDPSALGTLIEQLCRKNVSGLAIKLSRFIKCLPAPVLEIADRLDFPVISLPSNVQFDRVILEAFSHIIEEDYVEIKTSGDLSKRLQEIAVGGGTLEEVAQALAGWCGGEVVIKSPEGRVLAQSAGRSVKPGVPGSVSYEKQVTFDGRLYAVITLNLWRRTVSRADLELIDSAIPSIIMILFQISLRAHIQKREESLNDLLLGRMVLSPKNMEYISSLGVDLASPCTVCVLRAGRLQGESYDLLAHAVTQALEEAVGTRGVWPVITKMQGCMVHLYFSEQHGPAALAGLYQKLLAEISRMMPDIPLSVGIGRRAKKAGRINAGFLEAQKALDIGAQIFGRGGVYLYENLAVESLLSHLPLDEELVEFVEGELGALIAYDRRKKKQLLLTLEELLTGDSDTAIAKRMFLHPKTLAYRRSRIEQILGEELDGTSKRVRLLIALRLYRLNSLRWKGRLGGQES
ncbi:PucR family transcriptional regulator ligand-binding domain-containing protein [Anaerotruncus sp. AF02-27]|uniref:PucR family transcriptional regulator n=1 Tax=Anaerotruncus sp. AF02-27 TaxID=2292191 RepID=UPI001314BB81|nr:PucR family transcriptional regulator ligand-binding domain-containing protein [Anaerotruncus sp. AF02-27]